MDTEAEIRRPTRARKRQRYTVDAFEGLENAIYGSTDSGSSASEAEDSEPSDDEFGEEELQELAQDEDADAAEETELAELVSDEDRSSVGGEHDSDLDNDDIIDVISEEGNPRGKRRPRKGNHLTDKDGVPVPQQSRGLSESFAQIARSERMLMAVGQEVDDLIPFAQARDRWMNALSLPPRIPIKGKGGGLALSPFHKHSPEQASREWQWYTIRGGKTSIRNHQRCQIWNMNEMMAHPKDFPPDQPTKKFIAGPINLQSLHTLPGGRFTGVTELFPPPKSKVIRHGRSGWIINFGSSIQCLEWILYEGTIQYLAVSSRSGLAGVSDKAASNGNPIEISAYLPQPETDSYLYIYQFAATDTPKTGARINMDKKPILRAVLSFGWNELRRLKFCPVRLPNSEHGDLEKNRLGLMAGIWLDGYVRVLDIDMPDEEGAVIRVETAAFEARPPGTVCTAVTWLSASSIAVSCANGSVAIWNIADSIGKKNPRPWFYKSISDSYILNIVSGYPSRPTFIFTGGIDGNTQMTDVRDPRADIVLAARQRLMQPPLAWVDQTQCLLAPDDSFQLNAHFLRYFHASMCINRLNSTVLDVATSDLHAYVLASCTDGSVFSMNVMTKLRSAKKVETNRQLWFKH